MGLRCEHKTCGPHDPCFPLAHHLTCTGLGVSYERGTHILRRIIEVSRKKNEIIVQHKLQANVVSRQAGVGLRCEHKKCGPQDPCFPPLKVPTPDPCFPPNSYLPLEARPSANFECWLIKLVPSVGHGLRGTVETVVCGVTARSADRRTPASLL